jgi:hypothetical protein
MASKRRQRRNGCTGKKRYPDLESALRACREHKRKFSVNMKAYRCQFCSGWHIAHSNTPWGMDRLFKKGGK